MKTTAMKNLIAALACLTTMGATVSFAAEIPAYKEAVSSYLQQIITTTEAGSMVGNSAVITIAYTKNGQFDQAAVSGAGEITLARKIHQGVNWKQFPTNGKAETTIIVAINTAGKSDRSHVVL